MGLIPIRAALILIFTYSVQMNAQQNRIVAGTKQSKNLCAELSDEKLLFQIAETEQRFICKKSFSVGSACAGLAAGSVFGAIKFKKFLAEKASFKEIYENLQDLAIAAQNHHGHVHAHIRAAQSGDLNLAQNTGADADAKKAVKKAEEKMRLIFEKLSKEPPEKIAYILSQMKSNLGTPPSEILAQIERLAQVFNFNPKEAQPYHKIASQLIEKLNTMLVRKPGQVWKSIYKSEVTLVDKEAIKKALKKISKASFTVLDSRILAALGGTTFSAIVAGAYLTPTSCGADSRSLYITLDSDCRYQVEISEAVLNFLNLDSQLQLSLLRTDSEMCDFYLTLAQKLKLDDLSSEKVASSLKNLRCDNKISFEVNDSNEHSRFSIILNSKKQPLGIKNSESNEALQFTDDGNLSKYCSASSNCQPINASAPSKIIERSGKLLETLKFAASEAVECCTSTNEFKENCTAKYNSSESVQRNQQTINRTSNSR